MSIKAAKELAGMRAAGLVVRRTLEAMKRAVRPGVTTAEVDEAGAQIIREHGARPAPALVYGFPGARKIREGDLVKLDVTIEKDGFMADAAVTIGVGEISEQKSRLMACAERAFHHAMKFARAGVRVAEIGGAIEREVRRSGFSVVRELGGHGIGRTIHEPPSVSNYLEPNSKDILTEGLVITVEPIIASGSGKVVVGADGWTDGRNQRRRNGRALRTYFGDYEAATNSADSCLSLDDRKSRELVCGWRLSTRANFR
jgi:methionyl aminopeptidase